MNPSLERSIQSLKMSRDLNKADQMRAYMKYKFEYLGVQTKLRNELSKDFLKEIKTTKSIDWDIVWYLWDLDEREFQYLALSYLDKMKNYLNKADIHQIAKLISTKSWWDSVDGTVKLVATLVTKYPELKEEVIRKWALQDNIWLIRISIIYQLHLKTDTDLDLLSFAILENCNTKEFFINKAIGWALREYSKTNAKWVKDFINKHELHPLSIREGLKIIKN